jgi:hypothetical protein
VRHEGRVRACGVDKGVTFVDADDDIDDEMARSGTRTSQMRNRQRRQGPTG